MTDDLVQQWVKKAEEDWTGIVRLRASGLEEVAHLDLFAETRHDSSRTVKTQSVIALANPLVDLCAGSLLNPAGTQTGAGVAPDDMLHIQAMRGLVLDQLASFPQDISHGPSRFGIHVSCREAVQS